MSAAMPMVLALTSSAAPVAKIGHAAPATPGIGGALVALLLVLALILGLAWLLRRLPGARLGLHQHDQLRLVTSLAIGSKERLLVVEVGGEQLLLGVTSGGITPLHRLPHPLVTPAPPPLPNFAELLAKRLRKEN